MISGRSSDIIINLYVFRNGDNISFVLLGDIHPEPITCLASDGELIYTAAGKTLRAFKRGQHVSLFVLLTKTFTIYIYAIYIIGWEYN